MADFCYLPKEGVYDIWLLIKHISVFAEKYIRSVSELEEIIQFEMVIFVSEIVCI